MTDWTERQLPLDLSFLSEGNYEAIICEDGKNADRYPSDYILHKKQVTKNTRLMLKMSPGGGYVMWLQRSSK